MLLFAPCVAVLLTSMAPYKDPLLTHMCSCAQPNTTRAVPLLLAVVVVVVSTPLPPLSPSLYSIALGRGHAHMAAGPAM